MSACATGRSVSRGDRRSVRLALIAFPCPLFTVTRTGGFDGERHARFTCGKPYRTICIRIGLHLSLPAEARQTGGRGRGRFYETNCSKKRREFPFKKVLSTRDSGSPVTFPRKQAAAAVSISLPGSAMNS